MTRTTFNILLLQSVAISNHGCSSDSRDSFEWNVRVAAQGTTLDEVELTADGLTLGRRTFAGRRWTESFTADVPLDEKKRPPYRLVSRRVSSSEKLDEIVLRPFVCDETDFGPDAIEEHNIALGTDGRFRVGVDPAWGALFSRCTTESATGGSGVSTHIPEVGCGEGEDHSEVNVELTDGSVDPVSCSNFLYVSGPIHGLTFQVQLESAEFGEITVQVGACIDDPNMERPFEVSLSEPSDCPLFSGATWQKPDSKVWEEVQFTDGTWRIDELGFDEDGRHVGYVEGTILIAERELKLQASVNAPTYRDLSWDW